MVKLAEIWIKFLVKFSQKFCVRGESFFDFLCLINRRVFIALPDNREGSNDMYDTVRRGGQADTTRTGGEKSMKKRIISVLLLCCMVLGLLPTTTFANNGGAKAIQIGTSGISGYDSTNSSYDYIHFGTWNNSPIKWRVLDTKTNMANAQQGDGFFLLSEALLGTGEYGSVEFDYTTPYTNDWKGSRAQDWCNYFYNRNLSTTEQKAVLSTSKSDALYRYYAISDNILDGDIVKKGSGFTAPASDGLTRPDGNTGSYFKWRGSDGKLYAPGDNVPADVTSLTAQFDDSGTYTVTVKTDGNGTASASPARAAAGTEITLTATPDTGYRFREWQVESPAGLVISNGRFTMPDNNVAIKAIFKDISKEQFRLAPGGTYYFDLSGAGIPGTANDALPDSTIHYVPLPII